MDLLVVKTAIGELREDEAIALLTEFVRMNPPESEVRQVIAACQEGMTLVGDLFERGEYFVGDLIFAGELMTEAMDLLKSSFHKTAMEKRGTIVLGTVQGDLHDIGKNIFKNLAEAAGYEVFDLGIDQPVQAFVDRVRSLKPDIVGLSGMLTLVLENMKEVVDGLRSAGLRDDVKVIIGGSPVTKEACGYIGADGFTTQASEGLKMIQCWMQKNK